MSGKRATDGPKESEDPMVDDLINILAEVHEVKAHPPYACGCCCTPGACARAVAKFLKERG